MGKCMSKPPNLDIMNEMPEEDELNEEEEEVQNEIVSQEEVIQEPAVLKLQHILEAIYDAATKAQTNVQLNNLHNLFWMFPENEEGVHEPRTIPIKVNNNIIDVPVFTLIHHKNLCIHELKIKTKLDIHMKDIPFIKNEIKDVKNKRYEMHITPGKSDTAIELCMKIEEPTEAYNRMLKNFEMHLGR